MGCCGSVVVAGVVVFFFLRFCGVSVVVVVMALVGCWW